MDSYDDKGENPAPPPGRPPSPPPGPSRGIAGLSFPYQVVAALALAVVALVAVVHVAMVFLHVAPDNTVSKRYGEQVGDWVFPEFEQNWKLFAPNPSSRTSPSRSAPRSARRTDRATRPAGSI